MFILFTNFSATKSVMFQSQQKKVKVWSFSYWKLCDFFSTQFVSDFILSIVHFLINTLLNIPFQCHQFLIPNDMIKTEYDKLGILLIAAVSLLIKWAFFPLISFKSINIFLIGSSWLLEIHSLISHPQWYD